MLAKSLLIMIICTEPSKVLPTYNDKITVIIALGYMLDGNL